MPRASLTSPSCRSRSSRGWARSAPRRSRRSTSRPCSTSSRTTRAATSTRRSSRRSATCGSTSRAGCSGGWCRRRRCPGGAGARPARELRITDGSGYLRITFFNQPWRTRQLPEGSEGMFFGKVTEYRGQLQMANPEIDLLDEDDRLQIAAIYPQSDKLRLYSKEFRAWVGESLRRTVEFVDPVPGWVLDQHDFVDRNAALRSIHQPETMREAEEARRRLVFDELLRIQLALVLRKRRIEETSQGIEHVTSGALVRAVPRPAAVRAHRRPGEGDRRDHRRPGPSDPDAPPAAGRRGRRQDGGRDRGAAHRRAGRAPGRVHGAHRGAGRAAPRQHAAAGSTASPCPTTGRRCSASVRSPSSCSPTGSPARSASGCSTGSPPVRSTCWSAPTR